MAAHEGTSRVTVNGPAQAAKLRHQNDLPTPESTPVPEEARIWADKERRARAEGRPDTLGSVAENPGGEPSSVSQPKPPFDVGSQDHPGSESDSDGSDNELSPLSAAQVDAVQHVLSCSRNEYRQILKLGSPSADAQKDRKDVVNSLRKLGCLLNPDYNKAKGADKAFKLLLRAAKKEHVNQEDINELKTWHGDEELGELRLTADGKWADKSSAMEGIETSTAELKPTEVHQEIWRDAKPAFGGLMNDPQDEGAMRKLKEANVTAC